MIAVSDPRVARAERQTNSAAALRRIGPRSYASAPLAVLLGLLAACGEWPGGRAASKASEAAPRDAQLGPDELGKLRLDEVYAFATHNSYWVRRTGLVDAFAGGTEERLLDQLLFDHARGLEIDLHPDGEPGRFTIYHTDRPEHSFCDDLETCLEQLAVFHYAVPAHDPVLVVLEMKQTDRVADRVFNGTTHRPEDIDATLEKVLGPHLYRPDDLLDRCPGVDHLRPCVKASGWPTLDELRGKFIFTVLGNWNHWPATGLGNSADWVEYANPPDGIRTRSAFPMESPWQGCKLDLPLEQVKTALLNSPFIQAEVHSSGPLVLAGADPRPQEVVGDVCRTAELGIFASGSHILPRIGVGYPSKEQGGGLSTARMDWQELVVAAGYPFIQTDHPWYTFDDRGPAYPYRPLDPSIEGAPLEPGERVVFVRLEPDARGALALPVPQATSSRLETLVSLTRPVTQPAYPNRHAPRGLGCLVAAGADRSLDAVRVCRTTVDGEHAEIVLEVIDDGEVHREEVRSEDRVSGAYGELLRLEVAGECVKAFSASHIEAGAPAWSPIGGARCVGTPLVAHALEAEGGDVLFVRTRRAWLTGDGWSEASVEVDASVSGGYAIVDPADPATRPLFSGVIERVGKERKYLRGAGTVPVCAPEQDADAGLCHVECDPGYHGVGPVCWGECPEGYADDGATCRKDPVIAVKPSYERGVGSVPASCPDGQVDAGLCYPWCEDGYHGVGPVCWQSCPEGYADDGASCRVDAEIFGSDTSECPWYDVCGVATAKGCSKCPPGYANDGCTCRRDAHIFFKSSYGRGAGTPMSCAADQQYDAGLCYPWCEEGYHGVGPLCWGTCPADFVDDGGTCRKDGEITGKPSYGRGVGGVPDQCAPGDSLEAGLCYATCADGHTPQVVECIPKCLPGFVEDGDECQML